MKIKTTLGNLSDGLSAKWLDEALTAVQKSRVTVFGDFCLDGYWILNGDASDISVETGLPIHRVKNQQYSSGGAGNVAANLMALGVAGVSAVGLVGDDMFAGILRGLLTNAGVDAKRLVTAPAPWQTASYIKPYCGTDELNRFDFGAENVFPEDQLAGLLKMLDEAASASTAVVINQQLEGSVCSKSSINAINQMIARYPQVRFIVDARQCAKEFVGAILKVNALEAGWMVGRKWELGAMISQADAYDVAFELTQQTGQPVFVTRGEHGIIVADQDMVIDIPGVQNMAKTDPVGAGDTVVATLAAALGGGVDLETAARLANLAATVTVNKLRTTGTACPAELKAIGPYPDYVYESELAESSRSAKYIDSTEIEIVRESPVRKIKHAIFDHDGTLSTLRQGWEKIMEPMMLKAVLGDQITTVSADVYRRVEKDLRAFIDKTTGIQTLAQMKGLIALVKEYGFIPDEKVLDEHGYKAIYNEALLEMVNVRIEKIRRGELSSQDFEIKGARQMLEALHAAGVTIYLASGTDVADVKAEAEVMGYAHLFTGGIHGAVGDLNVEAKRVVIDRILDGGHLKGSELMVVGDGPVELREGKKRGALCLGIASNELCRFGLDLTKRTRVIRAGADYVIPDFSQLAQLKPLLGL